MIQLFGSYTSPFVRHCRIALMESELEAEFIEATGQDSAAQSPTQRVPYLLSGTTQLTDSTSIIRFFREQSGKSFLPTIDDLDRFCMINTALDSAVNLFLLERSQVNISEVPYLERQNARVITTLKKLNELTWTSSQEPSTYNNNDVVWRLSCMLDWFTYRNRYDISEFSSLVEILEGAKSHAVFRDTAPPKDA